MWNNFFKKIFENLKKNLKKISKKIFQKFKKVKSYLDLKNGFRNLPSISRAEGCLRLSI